MSEEKWGPRKYKKGTLDAFMPLPDREDLSAKSLKGAPTEMLSIAPHKPQHDTPFEPNPIVWPLLTDAQVFLILSGLEALEMHKSQTAHLKTQQAAHDLEKAATKEYARRNLHWSMFEDDE